MPQKPDDDDLLVKMKSYRMYLQSFKARRKYPDNEQRGYYVEQVSNCIYDYVTRIKPATLAGNMDDKMRKLFYKMAMTLQDGGFYGDWDQEV